MDSDLFREAEERALRYLDNLPTRAVAPSKDAMQGLKRLDEPLPETPGDPRDTIRILDEVGSPATMATAGPRFFGFVIGGALPVTVAAQWLAAAWDQNVGRQDITPAASQLEWVALRWLVDLLGLPAGTGAAFVTGASVANMAALAAGRRAVLERAGWDVEERGLYGAPEIQVVVGAEAHPTLTKALGLLGLGRHRVHEVPVDEQGRMRADALPALEGPAIVCLQAGNVNTGAFDPAAEIIPKA
ncbi:MAG: pyridoxal-dependent decarboxylase, partial [Thermoanaerobaculia bacterium]|nr:pyridoxal-dependent decarboxylase [Thermoanaerobaculia bacterium]